MASTRAYAQLALDHIRHLAETIGPRGSTTSGEREAAENARRIMADLGFEARIESFAAGRSTYRPFVLALGGALLAGVLSAVVAHPVTAPLAALASGLGAWGMFAELDFTRNWVRRLLLGMPSQNTVGVVPAAGERRRRVVLLGHVEPHRTPIFYSSTTWHRLFVTLIGSTLLSMALGVPVYIVLAVSGWRWIYGLATLFGAVQLFSLIMCLHADTTPYGPGANDNASGVGSSWRWAAG
ncbi:MAG: M28 family metallopeptidase [Anaerolineae bacterium]|nr:M28 family metallopeptidase [Anaerolineae bacterium]